MNGSVRRRWSDWRAERHAVGDFRRAWRALVHYQRLRLAARNDVHPDHQLGRSSGRPAQRGMP